IIVDVTSLNETICRLFLKIETSKRRISGNELCKCHKSLQIIKWTLCLILFCIQSIQVLTQYFDHEVSPSFVMKKDDRITMPSFTVCLQKNSSLPIGCQSLTPCDLNPPPHFTW